MTLDEYNDYCASLPVTTSVVQWHGSHVWKVGGKVFAIAGWQDEGNQYLAVTFKVTDIGWEMLKEAPGCRPAPYMASRGMKWIQSYDQPGLSDDELKSYIDVSHKLVAQGLSKKKQRELGLLP